MNKIDALKIGAWSAGIAAATYIGAGLVFEGASDERMRADEVAAATEACRAEFQPEEHTVTKLTTDCKRIFFALPLKYSIDNSEPYPDTDHDFPAVP